MSEIIHTFATANSTIMDMGNLVGSLPPLMEGDMLGEYRIVSDTVNAGGFGRIYKAKKEGDEHEYAIKEFYLNVLKDSRTQLSMMGCSGEESIGRLRDEFLEAFKAESRIMKELGRSARDRHIPLIKHAARESDGRWYYVMEYIDAPTLKEYIDEHGSMAEVEALNHIAQVSKVLYSMHKWGVCHCDISPNNIMVRRAYAVLVDFGNARYYQNLLSGESAPQVEFSVGTMGYAARPEISKTPAGDVYSLAATLFFMLTAKVPTLEQQQNRQLLQEHEVSGETSSAILHILHPQEGESAGDIREFLMALPSEAVFDSLLNYSAYDYKNAKRI